MTNWLCQPSNPDLSFRLGLPNCLSSRPTKTPAAARRPDRNLTNYYTVGKIDVHTSLWGVSGNAAVVLFGMKSLLVLVFCLLVVDHGVSSAGVPLPPVADWLVIMQRFDGSLNFNRNWIDYRNGFGELGGKREFWLGNELIHLLTSTAVYTLRIEVQLIDGPVLYADYAKFSLDSEAKKYAIHVTGFSGNAGDSLSNTTVATKWNHNGMSFSTPDADNDKVSHNCAKQYSAGWWFNGCWYSCLTCKYGVDFAWESLLHLPSRGRLQGARMRIKLA